MPANPKTGRLFGRLPGPALRFGPGPGCPGVRFAPVLRTAPFGRALPILAATPVSPDAPPTPPAARQRPQTAHPALPLVHSLGPGRRFHAYRSLCYAAPRSFVAPFLRSSLPQLAPRRSLPAFQRRPAPRFNSSPRYSRNNTQRPPHASPPHGRPRRRLPALAPAPPARRRGPRRAAHQPPPPLPKLPQRSPPTARQRPKRRTRPYPSP